MALQTPSIRVPRERMAQVDAIAKKRGLSYADLIGFWIEREIAEGTISGDVPGVTVRREADQIVIEMGDITRSLSREVASAFAGDIRGVSDLARRMAKSLGGLAPNGVAKSTAEALGGLEVKKRGRGVKLIDSQTGAERTVSPSVAEDIARLIEKAAT